MRQALLFQESPAQVLKHFDQGDSSNCIFYSFASCLAWNTGDIMSESWILRMSDTIKPWKPAIKIPLIAKEVAKYYEMYEATGDWTPFLKMWWGILVYLRPTREFWIDVYDGKLDEKQTPGDGMDHEGWIHEVDWKVTFENSWKNLPSFDITGKVKEMRENWLMPWSWYIFIKKWNV